MKIYANVHVKEINIPRGYLQIAALPNSLFSEFIFIALLGNYLFMFIIHSWSLKGLHFYCNILICFAAQTFPVLTSSLFKVIYPLLKSVCGLSMYFLLSFLPDFFYNAFNRSATFPELSKLEMNSSGY